MDRAEDAVFRYGYKALAFLSHAMRQSFRRTGDGDPIVVFGKNRRPPMALLAYDPTDMGRKIERLSQAEWMLYPILWVPQLGTIVPWEACVRLMQARGAVMGFAQRKEHG